MDIPARAERRCVLLANSDEGKGEEENKKKYHISGPTEHSSLLFGSLFFLWTSFFLKKRENFQLKKQPSSDPMVEARKNTTLKFYLLWLNDRRRKYQEIYQKKNKNWSSQQHIYLIWNEISSERSQHQHLEPFSFAPKCGLSEWVNHLFRMHHGRQRCVCTSEESSPAPHK